MCHELNLDYNADLLGYVLHVLAFCRMSYVRTSQRGSWEESNMEEALRQVLNKDLSLREAATAYNVPKSTLARRAIGKNKYVTGAKKHLGRFLPDFLPEYEEEYIWQATSKRWKPVSSG